MSELSNGCNIFTYSLVCLKSSLMYNIEKTIMKLIFVIFSHCHWRKFDWGNRILLFCSVNANLRSMILSVHFSLSMIFSSWLNFEYLLKRHLTLILKFLDFPWLLSWNLTALHGAQSAFSDSALSVIDW